MRRTISCFVIASAIFIAACGSASTTETTNIVTTDTIRTATIDSVASEAPVAESKTDMDSAINETSDYATYYIVIADTGNDYYSLRGKMFDLNKRLSIPIDTLGRYYNKEKKRIVLPDNDEDEMYAGEYYPRRDLAENLSLDYLNIFTRNAGDNTIALVSGIYGNEQEATAALSRLKSSSEKAFSMKSQVYVGCMH